LNDDLDPEVLDVALSHPPDGHGARVGQGEGHGGPPSRWVVTGESDE
jgi:hypothetical protein